MTVRVRRIYQVESREGKRFGVELSSGKALVVSEPELRDYPALAFAVRLKTGERLEEPALAGFWEAFLGRWIPIGSGT